MLLYGFTPIPSCQDPNTLQYYRSHNETLEDCITERKKYISGRIYFAMAIFNALVIISSTLLFIHCASSKKPITGKLNENKLAWKKYSLQKKSVTCTTMAALGHLGFSTCVFLAQASNPFLACYLILYGAILGFYTWIFAFCTKAYRLGYLFRLNQFKVKYAHMSEEEKTRLTNKEYKWYLSHNYRDARHVLRIPLLIYVLSVLIILAITIPSHQHAVSRFQRCDTTWGASTLLGMFGFFIVVITPWTNYFLKNNPDAHGIRTEFWILALVGIPLFVLNAVFFFKLFPAQSNPQAYLGRLFAPANWIMFFTAIAHFVTVIVPLLEYAYLYSLQRKRHTRHLELTIECLERALRDKDLMDQLQTYAIRDFSSENVLFYEKYLQLQDKVQHCPSYKLLPEFIELYESFIQENASFQVNISHKARSSLDLAFEVLYKACPQWAPHRVAAVGEWHELSHVSSGLVVCPEELSINLQLFEQARAEVCWNIFNSVYPKLVDLKD